MTEQSQIQQQATPMSLLEDVRGDPISQNFNSKSVTMANNMTSIGLPTNSVDYSKGTVSMSGLTPIQGQNIQVSSSKEQTAYQTQATQQKAKNQANPKIISPW